jgi:hypothetical protein
MITAVYAGNSIYRSSQAVTTHEVTPTYTISGIIRIRMATRWKASV